MALQKTRSDYLEIATTRRSFSAVLAQAASSFSTIKTNPLFTEHLSIAALGGEDAHSWDNMHQTYRSQVSEPTHHLVTRRLSGGCPECLHTHWRWGKHTGQAFNNGKLLLPSGSNQSLSFAVVRYHPGEERKPVIQLLGITDLTGPELIRSPSRGGEREKFDYSVPEEVVYWLMANTKSEPRNSDAFFDYYSFFFASRARQARTIIKDAAHAGVAEPQTAGSLSSPTQDAPTSIVYNELFKDGITRYTERNPSEIAALPTDYAAYSSVSYDVRTEAGVSGPHTITFDLPSVTDQTTFDSLRILHSERDPFDPNGAKWVDRTILSPNAPAPDFANRKLSAQVNEVGPFVIARLTAPPAPPNTNVADLAVAIVESADPIAAESELTYTVNVTNNGQHTATGVVLTNGLPPDAAFVSADAGLSRFSRAQDGTILCDLSSIAVGATIPVVIVVKPSEGQTSFPADGKILANVAFVSANETDPNEANNSATANTTALPNPNPPPTVKMISPSFGAVYAGGQLVPLAAEAKDTYPGNIEQVEFFDNGVSLGMAARSGSNQSTQYVMTRRDFAVGEHSIVAVATDNGGRKAVSDLATFIINSAASVVFDSPTDNNLFVKPANILLKATATAATGGSIAQVEFFADGVSLGVRDLPATGNQYSLTWNNATAGVHYLKAVATDNTGAKSHSFLEKIFVTNAPTVSMTSPATNVSYPKPADVTFTANAKDFDGYVSKVEFFSNGGNLGAGTLIQDGIYRLTRSNFPVGTHSVTAVATDDWGAQTVSSPINVTVTTLPPTVNLTSPANAATFTAPANISLAASAADGDGYIRRVDFFNGAALLGSDYPASGSSSPSIFNWNNVLPGTYILSAKATDDDNVVAASNSVTVTVNPVGDALLVVGSTTLNAVDNAIKTRLQNLGLTVTVKAATAAIGADASGKRVVVVSDTVSPANVTTKFKNVAVPVVTLDPQLFDDMGMTGTVANTDFGTLASQRSVAIANSTHSTLR